jgi:hypothetical protein
MVKMKRWLAVTLAVIVIVVVVVSAFAAMGDFELSSPWAPVAAKKPFYVGVTYCGDNVTEACQLVDKVKGYTNLFVVQSGSLMDNLTEMEQICDYAVNAGLYIVVYYSNTGGAEESCDAFLANATDRYGSHFLGIYYDDEPGGKMLDDSVNLYDNETGEAIGKDADGTISVSFDLGPSFLSFRPSGEIDVSNSSVSNETVGGVSNVTVATNKNVTYYSNGTIVSAMSSFSSYSNGTWVSIIGDPITYEPNGIVISGNETIRTGEGILLLGGPIGEDANITQQPITDPGSIAQFEPYQRLLDLRPLQTSAEAAQAYLDTEQSILSSISNKSDVRLFTSDYALDWYDYKAGYDVVLGELGWNQSFTQDIDQVRGAADMSGESWGTMIDWASQNPPVLQTEDQMYKAMRQSYESGAEYVVVFNYQGDQQVQISNQQVQISNISVPTGNGLLQAPQFAAIQKFWTHVVENPRETNNVKAQDALVLPENFGGGLRSQSDGTWGIWQANSTSLQVWSTLQSTLDKYGSKLDVIYDDSSQAVANQYKHVVYWNQTA